MPIKRLKRALEAFGGRRGDDFAKTAKDLDDLAAERRARELEAPGEELPTDTGVARRADKVQDEADDLRAQIAASQDRADALRGRPAPADVSASGPGTVQPLVRNVEVGAIRTGLNQINSPSDAAHVIASIRKSPQEEFLAIVTDDAGEVLQVLRHTKGTSDASQIQPAVLIGSILEVPNAKTVWFAHNHPSGNPQQSSADISINDQMTNLLNGTGVTNEGMVVVAPGGKVASWTDAGGQPHGINVTAAPRRSTVPLSERQFRALPKDLPTVSSSEAAIAYREQLGPGILFMDARNQPVGFLKVFGDEMEKLRGGKQADIFKTAHQRNASQAIVFGAEGPGQNAATLLRQARITPLDIVTPGGRSLASTTTPLARASETPIGFNKVFYTAAGTVGATAALESEEAEAGILNIGRRISTRFPTAAKAIENPLTDDLQIDIDAMLAGGAEGFAKNAGIVGQQVKTRAKSPAGRTQAFLDQGVDNLMWLHALVPNEVRVASRDWYVGANRVARDLAEQNGVSGESASGVLAALSPQQDWYINVSLAERVLDTMGVIKRGYTKADKEHLATARRLWKQDQFGDDLKALASKPFEALNPEQKAMFVRSFDETNNDKSFDILHPNGDRQGLVTKKDGAPQKIAWGTNNTISNAISVIEDPSINNISRRMGLGHKVRSFYNNISDPAHSVDLPELGDVTMDTHAVAALLMRPLSGQSREVAANFGRGVGASNSAITGARGTYGINADAYRKAAAELGIMPRELQSITWDAARTLFPRVLKNNKGAVADIESVWALHRNGKLTRDQARTLIVEKVGGLDEPDWVVRPGSGVLVPRRAAGDQGAVSAASVPAAGARDRRAGLIASGLPAAWLGLGGAGVLTSEDAEAAAIATHRPRRQLPPEEFQAAIDSLQAVGADRDLGGNNISPRINDAMNAFGVLDSPTVEAAEIAPDDVLGGVRQDFQVARLGKARRRQAPIDPRVVDLASKTTGFIDTAAGLGETALAVGSAIGSGLVGDVSRIGGALNPFMSVDETEAGAAALEEQLQFQPSENAVGGEMLQSLLERVEKEGGKASERLGLEESIPGRIFDALPERAKMIIRTTIGF